MAKTVKQRIVEHFRKRGVLIHPQKDAGFLEFISKELWSERQRITYPFINRMVAKYSNLPEEIAFELLKLKRPRRATARYRAEQEIEKPSRHSTQNMIQMLGRKGSSRYKATSLSGEPLTPKRKAAIRKITPTNAEISYSPYKTKTPHKRQVIPQIRSTENSHVYTRAVDLGNHNIAFWQQDTPQKPHYPVRFYENDDASLATLFQQDDQPENISIEYTITREDITKRIGKKRPCSQKQVMRNQTAMDVFKAIGAVIHDKQSGRDFHWAHRRGWSLGGTQTKDNLDPMTAGANYSTLFKVEQPIKDLLIDKHIKEISVRCQVMYSAETNLPCKVTYDLTWGNNKRMQVYIDPMSHRIPKTGDYEFAKSIM